MRIGIHKNGTKLGFMDTLAVEEARFSGLTNQMEFSRRYYAEYFCEFELTYFPFDTQLCYMDFKLRTATMDEVVLKAGNISYSGSKKMVEFTISEISILNVEANIKRSTKRLVMIFKRDYFYYLTQSFLTSLILGMLAYFTFFISIDDFNDRFMGSLTALLVLAALVSVYTSDLPKTSYFKVIDVWLQFFVLTTAINISAHIVIDNLRKQERREEMDGGFEEKENRVKKSKLKLTAKQVNDSFIVMFPTLFTIFILGISFFVALQPSKRVDDAAA